MPRIVLDGTTVCSRVMACTKCAATITVTVKTPGNRTGPSLADVLEMVVNAAAADGWMVIVDANGRGECPLHDGDD